MIDMDALVAKVRERRGPECLDAKGACHASPAVAAWHDKLIAMKAAGRTSAETKAALEPERQALRKEGQNI